MPRTQLYVFKNGKTQRVHNDIVYELHGVASSNHKTMLTNFLKTNIFPEQEPPSPWYILGQEEEDEMNEVQETESVATTDRIDFPIDDTVPVEETKPKVVIYNIKQVPDNRGHRIGYTNYRRL